MKKIIFPENKSDFHAFVGCYYVDVKNVNENISPVKDPPTDGD